MIVFQNDDVLNICEKLLDIKKPDFHSMNKVISHMLKSVLLPTTITQHYTTTNYLLQEIKRNLLLDPTYKLLNIKSVPQVSQKSKSFTCDTWDGITKRLSQMVLSNSNESLVDWNIKPGSDRANRSFAQQVILRGKGVSLGGIESLFYSGKTYTYADGHYLDGIEKTATCIQYCGDVVTLGF